ncbi:MAG: hypothetical protein ACYTF6_05610 [Planctomycetota bacterium]
MNRIRVITRKIKALHRDERGASMVEYILIVAAIALPLLGIAIWFRKDLRAWVRQAWEAMRGEAEVVD